MAQLFYGGGLRPMEALRLRIKDEDLEQRCITVRCGKGDKDRRTVLPSSLVEPLNRHLQGARGVNQAIWRRAGGRWSSPMPWSGNTGMRQGNGPGNGYSPRAAAGGIPTRYWR